MQKLFFNEPESAMLCRYKMYTLIRELQSQSRGTVQANLNQIMLNDDQ